MRFASVSVLVLSGFALAACTGEETTCGTITISPTGPCVTNGTSTSAAAAAAAAVVPIVPVPAGTGTSTNTGNTTTLATGDKTIALEFANLISPTTGSSSKLTVASLPSTAKIEIDTKTGSNAAWPIPKTMTEFVPGTNGGVGLGSSALGGNYKEYRAISYDTSGNLNDEELQVWKWNKSYATQYRDATAGGGEARHQAWSFGGNATAVASMPTGGTVNYAGKYGATSKTWNWVDDTTVTKTITANNSWRIEGDSAITANFDTGQMTGTLTPRTWNAFQTLNGATGFKNVIAGNTADPNHMGFMDDNVVLSGSITGNTVTGNANLDPAAGWVNGANPMYAGFFGPTANEVTGAFNFVAVLPAPIGGVMPINDDRRGFVQQSGIFHGQ